MPSLVKKTNRTKPRRNEGLLNSKPKRRVLVGGGAALAVVVAIAVFAGIKLGGLSLAYVPQAFCNRAAPSTCMNRAGGGSGYGTSVIDWIKDFDNNEDVSLVPIYYCSGGNHVTAHCPFTTDALNSRYLGASILEVKFTNVNKCLIPISANNGTGVLGTCANSSGSGGSAGVLQVWNGSHYLVNRMLSDKFNAPSWVCGQTQGHSVFLDSSVGYGPCQWDIVYR